MKDQKFPIYYSGNPKLFDFLQDVRIEGTLILPQPFVMSFQPEFLNVSQRCFLEPLLTVIVVNEEFKETIVRNGFKNVQQNTIYVYFPYEVRVDDTLYKKAIGNYETLIKEVPRSQRDYFTKLVVWEQGKVENSVAFQVNKISQIISRELKISIEKKVALLNEQSAKIESEPLTFSKIAKLHTCKLKLLKIYEYLKMHSQATPMLMDQYQYICLNKFYFKNATLNESRNSTWNPSLLTSEEVFDMLTRQDIFLIEFMTHFYYQIFTHLCRTLRLIQALTFLKDYLSFIRSDVFERNPKPIEKVLQNIWLIQLVQSSLIVVQAQKNLLTLSRKAEIDVIQAGLKLMVRDALEEIGFLLFGFSQSVFHALNVSAEVEYMLNKLNTKSSNQQEILCKKVVEDPTFNDKLKQIVNKELRKTFQSYGSFIKYYVIYLEQMLTVLKDTKLKRVSFYLSMTILKAKTQFPWLAITNTFVNQDTRQYIKSWKGLELLCSLYLTLYHHMTSRKEQFQSEIGLVLGNSILNTNQRKLVMGFIEKDRQKVFSLTNFKVGKISRTSIKQLSSHVYEIQVKIEAFFEVQTDLFQKAQLTLINSRISDENEFKLIFSGKQIEYWNKNIINLKKTYETTQRMTISIKQLNFTRQNIIAITNVPTQMKKLTFQLNGIQISESWYFGNNNIYSHISTPYTIKMRGLKNCNLIKINYQHQKSFIIEQAKLDNEVFSISQNGQVSHNPETFESCFGFTITSSIPDPNICPFQLTFTFVFSEYDQVLSHTIEYRTLQSFQVIYQGSDRLHQFNITNIINSNLYVEAKSNDYLLSLGEQVSTRADIAHIGFRKDLIREIKLRDVCKNWQAIAKVRDRFKMRLQTTKLKVFQQVDIESEETGIIKVASHEGYQMIGKVKGRVQYKSIGSKVINLKLIPVRKGKIVLPDILIDNKKGQWNCPIVLDVQ